MQHNCCSSNTARVGDDHETREWSESDAELIKDHHTGEGNRGSEGTGQPANQCSLRTQRADGAAAVPFARGLTFFGWPYPRQLRFFYFGNASPFSLWLDFRNIPMVSVLLNIGRKKGGGGVIACSSQLPVRKYDSINLQSFVSVEFSSCSVRGWKCRGNFYPTL